jgi:hypothetical protein
MTIGECSQLSTIEEFVDQLPEPNGRDMIISNYFLLRAALSTNLPTTNEKDQF